MINIPKIIEKLNHLNRIVVKLFEEGDLNKAMLVTQQAIKLGQENLGEHPTTADSLNNLAELYRIQGRYLEAKALYLQVLNIRKNLFDREHPDIAQSLNNLATLYYLEGNYSSAEKYFLESLELWKLIWGEEHFEIATNLNNLAGIYQEQGRYLKSEQVHLEVLGMRKRLFGDEHPDIAQTLNNLACLYTSQGRYLDAEEMHLEALGMRKRLFGDEHYDIAVSLNNLALLYDYQGRYLEAETKYFLALNKLERILGNEHPYIASTLSNIAGNYKEQGRYAESEHKYLEVLAMRKRLLGDEHPDIATSLSNLGTIYRMQGRFLASEQKYLEAYEMRKRLFTSEHPDIAKSLNDLVIIYLSQGRYLEAEQKSLSALPMWSSWLEKEHSVAANYLDNLALLYRLQGQYAKAEKIYLEALAIRKNILGEKHPDIADSFNDIATIYRMQGRYPEAEEMHLKSLEMLKELLGEKHPLLAGILNNLAVLYDARFKYSQAESSLLQALLIIQALFGREHPQVASSMSNLATIYGNQGNYLEAEKLHLEVIKIRKSLFKEEHPDIANSLNNLALIYLSLGRYQLAEEKYVEALVMRKHLLGDEHPDTALSLNNLASVLAATQRPDEALLYRIQASDINDLMISNLFAFSSESDRLAFIQKLRGNFDLFLSLVYKHLAQKESAMSAALDLVLKRKALTAASLAAQNEALYSDRYPHLQEKFRQLGDLNVQLVNLTFSAAQNSDFTSYQKKLAQLQAQYNNLQKQLASQVPEIQLFEQPSNRYAVASALPADSILVEFVRFELFDFNAVPANGDIQWQPARYLAFVLPSGQPDAVQMIDLGPAQVIDELIWAFRLQASDYTKQTLGWKKAAQLPKLPIKLYNPASAIQLSQILVKPIFQALKDCKHLIFAPDGNLNLVPFQILPCDQTNTHLLMDKFTISYLSVGRDILRSQIPKLRPASTPLVIADPDFDLVGEQTDTTATIPFESLLAIAKQESSNEEFVNTLDGELLSRTLGTRFLGESVAKKLPDARLYLGAEALETHLTASKCPSIMLIATHGLFLADSPQAPFKTMHLEVSKIENPMMRSGLALAGANTWLSGGILPPSAGKGFIFAQDIASLDLWANELTVLSACDTARGDIKIGEGVFGLRRAFAVAGTKTLVMSLWKVPDQATALLMERFFDNLHLKMGRAEALQNAQNYIRQITVKELRQSALGMEVLKELLKVSDLSVNTKIDCQEEDTPLEHPFYWGAWICQGDTTQMHNKCIIS